MGAPTKIGSIGVGCLYCLAQEINATNSTVNMNLGVTHDEDLTTAVLEVVNKLFIDKLTQSHGEWLLGEEQAMIPARRLKKSSMSFLCQHIITT